MRDWNSARDSSESGEKDGVCSRAEECGGGDVSASGERRRGSRVSSMKGNQKSTVLNGRNLLLLASMNVFAQSLIREASPRLT